MGAKDLKGIWKYDETDDEATFSELLNIGQDSISDALAYFAGPPISREALTPAPAGAMWKDTDALGRVWSAGPTGAWRRHEGSATSAAVAWHNTTSPIYGRVITLDIPTVIGVNETIQVTMVSTTAAYPTISLVGVTRAADKTTLDVRFVSLQVPAIAAVTFAWRVVSAAS